MLCEAAPCWCVCVTAVYKHTHYITVWHHWVHTHQHTRLSVCGFRTTVTIGVSFRMWRVHLLLWASATASGNTHTHTHTHSSLSQGQCSFYIYFLLTDGSECVCVCVCVCVCSVCVCVCVCVCVQCPPCWFSLCDFSVITGVGDTHTQFLCKSGLHTDPPPLNIGFNVAEVHCG